MKTMSYKSNLIRRVIKENEKLDNTELLNWAMNQLYRAARTIDLLQLDHVAPASIGCDAAAAIILKRLVKTKRGYQMVKETYPHLVIGFKKP
jgi:hypothetical protein